MKAGELIAIGGAYLDINAPQFPLTEKGIELETEVVGDKYIVEPGGSAVNFARMCTAMEIPTTFIGKIGKDELGHILACQLLKASIQPCLIESDEVSTNVSFNMINSEGKTIMALVGSANQALSPEEVYSRASEIIGDSPYLYIGGCFKLKKLMPAFLELAADAKNLGTKIVLDHARLNVAVTESDKETVRNLAITSDIYLPSVDEFMQLWNAPTLKEGMLKFSKQSNSIIVVKNGAQGALTVVEGKIIVIPSFSVTPIHTVGAGDSFNAGFIAAQHKEQNLLDSIRFACATAALKISQPNLPTYAEVIEFISKEF